MRKRNGTATVEQLAVLASSVGLVDKSEQGRKAYAAWFANDPKAARKALFSRVAERRVAASGAKSAAPASGAPAQAKQYPRTWLRAAGVGVRRGNGPRISEGND